MKNDPPDHRIPRYLGPPPKSQKKPAAAAGGKPNNNDNLYGIKKLRELILELAVRGKLVPQNPDDEPASELLKKIAQEKDRLIKKGKIKKPKKLPEIGEDEKPLELPKGWKWVRFTRYFVLHSERQGTQIY